jgi:hypothetical protein
MARYFITFGLFLGAIPDNVFGQDLIPIQLDRPDQTECPFITPRKYIQVENGFNIEQSENGVKNFSFPTSLWKYGINDKLEIRLITELTTENKLTGLKPITIGFKTSLLEEKGIIPKTSFIGHIKTSKLGTKAFQTSYIAPSFRFTMQHTLSKKVSLAYNLGAEWDGETPNQTYLYTLTTGYSLTEKIGCYAEIYGYFQKESKADHRIDGGLTYLVSNNFMVDLSGGIGITENAPKYYLSFGISYRFKTTN